MQPQATLALGGNDLQEHGFCEQSARNGLCRRWRDLDAQVAAGAVVFGAPMLDDTNLFVNIE